MQDKIVRCKIKLIKDGSWSYEFIFGICSDIDCDLDLEFDYSNNQYAHYIQHNGHRYHIDIDKGIDTESKPYQGIEFKQDESINTIILILDLSNATLSFEKNDKSASVCYDNIVRKEGIQYGIALTICGTETLEILEYSEERL